jgi:hypothetical protein
MMFATRRGRQQSGLSKEQELQECLYQNNNNNNNNSGGSNQ